MSSLVASAINLNKHPYYFHWGVIQISAPNLIVICLMILVFVLAIVIPFPRERSRR